MITIRADGVASALAGMKSNRDRLEKAIGFGVVQVALAGERLAKGNFEGKHRLNKGSWSPKSWIPNSGGFPNVWTGNLRQSIKAQPVRKGFGSYTAEVYPGMAYAMRVEETFGHKYMLPAYVELSKQAERIFGLAVERKMNG